MTLKEKLIHLDLKGAPPKISYIEKLIPLNKQLGATGFLIEYEDMFPYHDDLEAVKAESAYSELEIGSLIETCSSNQLTVIPLIQAFGHLEFVLKHDGFKDLREMRYYPNVLCPSNPDSFELVSKIVSQIVETHSKYHDLRYIHIGCDEVWHLGECDKCKALCATKNWKKDQLFVCYVSQIANWIREKYSLNVIIWDDMLRAVDQNVISDFNLEKLVEPMVWHYLDAQNFLLNDMNLWNKYFALFNNVWIASAFKGATEVNQLLPPIPYHISNHLAWLQLLTKLDSSKLRGVALTGWQRFDHNMTLCELLPLGIPCLALCLQVLTFSEYTEEVHAKASRLLGFDTLLPISELRDEGAFPGSKFYHLTLELVRLKSEIHCLKLHPSLKGSFTNYLLKNNRMNPLHVHSYLPKAQLLRAQLEQLKKKLETEMQTIYEMGTIQEWLESFLVADVEELQRHIEKGEEMLKNAMVPS